MSTKAVQDPVELAPLISNVRALMTMPEPKDKHGRPVAVGSRIRIIELSRSFLESLPQDEIEDVRSMIGEEFEIYEIDKYGLLGSKRSGTFEKKVGANLTLWRSSRRRWSCLMTSRSNTSVNTDPLQRRCAPLPRSGYLSR